MKNKIYLLGVVLLLSNLVNSQISTNIKEDSLKKFIRTEVKTILENQDSIYIGVFTKLKSKVKVFSKNNRSFSKDKLNRISRRFDSEKISDKIFKVIEGRHLVYEEEINSIVTYLIKKQTDSIDVLIGEVRKDSMVNYIDFQEKFNNFLKSKREIKKKTKQELINIFSISKIIPKKADSIVHLVIQNQIETIDNGIKKLRKDIGISHLEFKEKFNNLSKKKTKLIKENKIKLIKYFRSINNEYTHVLNRSEKDSWRVERVLIDVHEGLIIDLTVTLFNEVSQRKRRFTNTNSVSIVRFRKYGHHKLFETNGNGNFVRVKDVLDYTANTGLNYFPDNALVTIGENDTKKPLQIKRGLNSILDLRVYTDFLGLLDEESNGIINFEASSTIKISPSPFVFSWLEWMLFKDIKPYFNYSRFDKQNRAIATDITTSASTFKINNKLNLIQNAFIKAGFEVNVLQMKASKEFPFAFSVPFFYEFNMTEVSLGSEKTMVNTYQMGTGLNLNLKRTKSFGLNLGMSYSEVKNKHSLNALEQEGSFHLLGFNSELYFYNPKDQNSAFFLRLKTRRIIHHENNYSSIQFGYKKAFSFSK